MEWVRFINKRRLSIWDIGCLTAITFAWTRLQDGWLAFCLFVAYVAIGAFMDAYVPIRLSPTGARC